MSELFKVKPNGQWILQKNWSSKHKKSISDWAETGLAAHINKVPRAEGKLRESMMGSLGEQTESRVNPKSGTKEYKLYRAAPVNSNHHEKSQTSWTAAPDFAYYWAHVQSPIDKKDEREPQQVIHSWVPDKHIHSYLHPILDKMGHEKAGEHEVIVHPHNAKIETVHKGPELQGKIKEVLKRHGME